MLRASVIQASPAFDQRNIHRVGQYAHEELRSQINDALCTSGHDEWSAAVVFDLEIRFSADKFDGARGGSHAHPYRGIGVELDLRAVGKHHLLPTTFWC